MFPFLFYKPSLFKCYWESFDWSRAIGVEGHGWYYWGGFCNGLVENKEKEDGFWFIAGEGSKATSLGGFPTMEKKKGNGVMGRGCWCSKNKN